MRAAPQHRQQQQQQASGAAAGGTAAVAAGGSVAAAAAAAASTQPAVPPFLLAKGYEILGVIGEVSPPASSLLEGGCCLHCPPTNLTTASPCVLPACPQGTFGRVYLARHSSQPGRFLALKHMKPPQVDGCPLYSCHHVGSSFLPLRAPFATCHMGFLPCPLLTAHCPPAHHAAPQKEYEGVCATALREVGLLRALSHPHLVSLEGMHMCVPDLALCLVFPYAETGDPPGDCTAARLHARLLVKPAAAAARPSCPPPVVIPSPSSGTATGPSLNSPT